MNGVENLSEPGSQPLRPHVFIVGMSRSGTSWLARSLNEHPDVTVIGETAYWGRQYVAPKGDSYSADDYTRLQEAYRDPLQLTEIERLEDGGAEFFREVARRGRERGEELSPGEFFQLVTSRIAEIAGTSLVVEKTPHHVHWLDRIVEGLPDVRFVVCLRDPYDFLVSYKHQGDRKPEPVREMFQDLYHPIVTAVVARRYLRTILDVADRFPEQSRLVRLEDVKEDSEAVLKEVQQFVDLEPVAELDVGPQETSFPAGGRPELKAAEVFWLNTVAGRAIIEAGYDVRSAGTVRLSWLQPVLTLPIAIPRVLRIVSGATRRSVIDYLRGWFRSS